MRFVTRRYTRRCAQASRVLSVNLYTVTRRYAPLRAVTRRCAPLRTGEPRPLGQPAYRYAPLRAVTRRCAQASRVLSVNLLGPLALTRALLPALAASHGRVVFLSSMAAVYAGPAQLIYSASKGGLEAAADSFRRDARAWGGHVSIVQPGSIGGGRSKMCDMPSVCNMPPSLTSTPAILHALFDASPAARYPVGPVSPPLLFGALQIPAWLALLVARPTPDWLLDALLRCVQHPLHSGAAPTHALERWW